jgi:hypothetical protein
VAYFPDGIGSVPSPDRSRLLYRDAHGTRTFGSHGIETTLVPGFGTVITFALARTVDMSETFSLILPPIMPPRAIGSPVSFRAFAVKTLQRARLHPSGEPQLEEYTVTALTGQAVSERLPLDTGRRGN